MKRLGKRFRPGAADSHYDLVIIGSGLGALVCAALMTLRGRRVCVLEQHYTLGGMLQSYERAGYEWDVGNNEVGGVTGGDSRLRRLFDVVSQGRLKWCEQPEFIDRILIGEQQYELPVDHEALAAALKAWFPFEHSAINGYFRLLASIEQKLDSAFAGKMLPRSISSLDRLWRRLSLPWVVWKTTADVLQSLTSNRQLTSVLASRWMTVGLPPGQSSFLAHALAANHFSSGMASSSGGGWKVVETVFAARLNFAVRWTPHAIPRSEKRDHEDTIAKTWILVEPRAFSR